MRPAARLVTTDEAAVILEVPADAIAKWKHRGKVTPVGMLQGRGRGGSVPLYRLNELQPLADRYRAAAIRRAERAALRGHAS